MKKVIVLFVVCFMSSVFAMAASSQNIGKIRNSKIIQATANTSFVYAGVQFFVPKGETLLLGQREDGTIVIRGFNIDKLQIEDSSFSAQGYSVLLYQPVTNVVFLKRGESLTVTDPSGVSSSVAQHGAISTTNAAINSDTVAQMKAAAQREAALAEQEFNNTPAFVNELATTTSAREQAAQDVEETLSPSSPR